MPALVNARLPGPNSTALARPGTARLELARVIAVLSRRGIEPTRRRGAMRVMAGLGP